MKKQMRVGVVGLLAALLLTTAWWKQGNEAAVGTDAVPATREAVMETYDVIVVGAEPEGVAAAVAAARRGLKTLLLEERDGVGGLMTYGALNYLDIADHEDQNVNAGLFREWHELVGGKPVFDTEKGKEAFARLVERESNLTFQPNTELKETVMSEDGSRILGVTVVSEEYGEQTFTGKRFVDCTQDADLAAMAGVPYFIGQEDIGRKTEMAVTLMIHLKGVDWAGIGKAFAQKKFGGGFVNENAAWGFWEVQNAYRPVEPKTRLRGLNIARNGDGSIYINALQILGVDGLDEEQKKAAYETGKRETENVVRFLRKEIPGFEKAEVASYPSELYVRETRHVLAEYQLSIVDVWENRDQWDGIGFGAYPVDIQATTVDKGDVVVVDPAKYAIPFRSLVPKKVDGLLVASRASGYSSLAAGSARTIPTGMTAAEAAGVAAALSLEYGMEFREMSKDQMMVARLRGELKKQGVLLEHYSVRFPYQDAWFYPAVKRLLMQGLVLAGYENSLREKEGMTELEFVRLVGALARKEGLVGVEAVVARLESGKPSGKVLNGNRLAELMLLAGEVELGDRKKVLAQAVEVGAVDEVLKGKVAAGREVPRGEGFYSVVRTVDWLNDRQ